MVFSNLSHLDAELFVQQVNRRIDSLCLFHRRADLGEPLLLALDALRSEGCPARRTLSFRPCRRDRALLVLRVRLVSESSDLRVMNIAWDAATIVMTTTGLMAVRRSVASWLDGGEDFGVGSNHAHLRRHELGPLDRSSAELWFWGPYYFSP